MSDNDARRTDLHAYMQQTVPPDPRPTPTTRCPRCARDVDPADLLAQPLAALRLINPHSARYDRQTADDRVAICDDCDQQLAAIAREMHTTQRRRLVRLWPRPTSPRGRLLPVLQRRDQGGRAGSCARRLAARRRRRWGPMAAWPGRHPCGHAPLRALQGRGTRAIRG